MKTFIDFILRLGFSFLSGNQLNILALSGVSKDGKKLKANDNAMNQYNDLLVCIMGNNVETFIGTVDPGAYYLRNPANRKGTAHAALTQHAFVRGFHHNRPALRARSERIWLMRDYDRNFRYSEGDILEIGVGTGLNIHAGGAADRAIGKWSAGCLNIADGWEGAPWKRFMEMVNESDRDYYPVTVWTGKDFLKFEKDQSGFRPTLHFGCIQNEVSEVQTRVGVRTVDGIFGSQTATAVKQFQKNYNLVSDGIVGDKTWSKLLG